MNDTELRRLESRWQLIGAGVLVLVCVVGVLVLAWMSTGDLRLVSQWDWVFEHHQLLAVLLLVAVAVIGALALVSWRQASWRPMAWSVVPAAVLVLVAGGWIIADRRSNAADIATRVSQVEAIFPSGAVRVSGSAGDNFRTELYVVDGDLASVSAALWTAARQHLANDAGVWADPKQGDTPSDVEISYVGRNGCDGSVQVGVVLAAGDSNTTTVRVGGHCED